MPTFDQVVHAKAVEIAALRVRTEQRSRPISRSELLEMSRGGQNQPGGAG